MVGNDHVGALYVALADRITNPGTVADFLARVTRTFINNKVGSVPRPNAFRMRMPLMVNDLPGDTSVG